MNFSKLILLLIISFLFISEIFSNDSYKKHNEIQYSNYYEKTDSILFNSNQLQICDTSLYLTVSDILYFSSNPTCSYVEEEYTADFYLDFRIGSDHYNFGKNFSNEFTIKCTVNVTLLGSPSVTLFTNKVLTIKYDPSTNKFFNPQEILKLEIDEDLSNYTGIEVTLAQYGIDVTGSAIDFNSIQSSIKSQIQLEAFYKLKRKYSGTTSSDPILKINSSYLSSNTYKYVDELDNLDFRMVRLQWEIDGCNSFEFEKYQVQILKLSNTLSNDQIYKDNLFDVNTKVDWNDAISIEVGDSKKFIDIYLTQGKGVYTWRVRPIGNMYEGGIANSQNWGAWNNYSIEDDSTIVYNHESDYDSAAFFRMYVEENIDDNMNWVHSRVFNESDESATKFYDEITYSDDLLGKRQYQKKVNSTDDNLTAEYYPDYHGNSVLSSLFAPISSSDHKTRDDLSWSSNYSTTPAPNHGANLLYKRYTLVNNSDKYSFSNFGTDNVSDIVDGGFIYNYYDNSNEKGRPFSEGYPFSRSIYYNDGTNRLKEQRLPGPVSHTNTNNLGKIRTFYATATEKELVSLFGKEAPNPQKVFKIINIDQNNVYHYTYKGIDGKVIATAYRNVATEDLLAINNTSGHSYVISEEEYLITDYYPIQNNNLLSYKEEKDIFVRDGSAAQVEYGITDRPLTIDVCKFNVSKELELESMNPSIGVDIQIITSNNDDYAGTPSIIARSTNTSSAESNTPSVTPFPLSSSEPATYKISRTVSLSKDDIDSEVESYKSNITNILKMNIFNEERDYLTEIINGEPDRSIEQFRKNLVPTTSGGLLPDEDWGWKDINGTTKYEGEPTTDGNYTKFIPCVGTDCNQYSIKIPQNICNSSDACYLELDLNDINDYEKLIIQNFASREIYENGDSPNPLDLNQIQNYFWEPTSLTNYDLKRLIPHSYTRFDQTNNTHNGAFNKMIANMLAEVYETDHYIVASLGLGDSVGKPIWTPEEICDCWNTAIDRFQAIGIITDDATGKEILNPEFSLMDQFLSCTGTMFKGYSNVPFENETFCLGGISSTPLDDNDEFVVCFEDPDDLPDEGSPTVGNGVRNPDIVFFGGGYFENAYKYLPIFIDESQINNIYSYDNTDELEPHEECPCDTEVIGNQIDNYKINLNPEYDDYTGLLVDEPKNLDFYYQYTTKTISVSDMQRHADFLFEPDTVFRNEYKRIYDEWHRRENYVSYSRRKFDSDEKITEKRDSLPDEFDPCGDRAKSTKDSIMTNELKSRLGSDFELPPCLQCEGSQSDCDLTDVTAYLYKYVEACEKSCDTRPFREAVITEFHTNSDAYYVVEGDTIRDFDFGTYEILYDGNGDFTGEMLPVGGTLGVDEVSFTAFNIVTVTLTEISRYEATLLAHCLSECQPNCFEPTIKKYTDNSRNRRQSTRTNPYTREQVEIRSKDKPIKNNYELEFDIECLLEDISRIMNVPSYSFELQLPTIDCDGNPSYCETGEESNWDILRTGGYYLDSEGELLPDYRNEEVYVEGLLNTMNNTLLEIKRMQLNIFDDDDYYGGRFRSLMPLGMRPGNYDKRIENEKIVYNSYRPFIYASPRVKAENYIYLDAYINGFDPNLNLIYDVHQDQNCGRAVNLEINANYKQSNEYGKGTEYKMDDGHLTIYTLHYRSKEYDLLKGIIPRIENNFFNVPDILYDDPEFLFFGIGDPFIDESQGAFAFPPNFIRINQRKVNGKHGYRDLIQLNDYFTRVGSYIVINRDIYDFYGATHDKYWNSDGTLKKYINGKYPLGEDYIIYNPHQVKRVITEDGERIVHIEGQFLKLPEFEEPEDAKSFCFRWVNPQDDNDFDQPFKQELIVNDCEFNEPDMYLEMIDTQIEDIAYKLAEEYRTKIMGAIQEYVYGETDAESDDLDELKVTLPAENSTKFTLYYYDHHGNLVKTVPPKGVNVDINRDRDDLAVHDMETMYQYNSTGQLVASKSADQSTDKSVVIGGVTCDYDGETVYIYDLAGRLRFTVNSNQMEGKERNEVNYPLATYYKYDKRGRLIETGEMLSYFTNHHSEDIPDFYTVGDYLRLYLDMKEEERETVPEDTLFRNFYKYQKNFSKYLLDSLDFPSDKNNVGTFVYTSLINPLYNGGSLSTSNEIYRPIKLKILTTYDVDQSPPFLSDYNINGTALTQKYLRNRISKITRIPDSEWEDGELLLNRVDSYYSYDPHGNVDWYYQHIQPHKTEAEPFGMLTHYEYDLISGNVTQIHYQPGKADEFTQIYDYDSDNRLKEVNTTRFGILKESDARYSYYQHGPLKRKEFGSDHVQGMDYYYTIQGWLKGINDVQINDYAGVDWLGYDGNSGINKKYAQDVFAMILNYYEDDFDCHLSSYFTTSANSLGKNLYNGNISSWQQLHNSNYNLTAIPNQEIKDLEILNRINVFDYDVSGRLVDSEIKKISSGSISALSAANRYSSGYDYDLNGNIAEMNRYDDNQVTPVNTTYESTFATYTDNSMKVHNLNRLTRVERNNNINDRTDYNYDNMGNIIGINIVHPPVPPHPPSNEAVNITWSSDGKISKVSKILQVPKLTIPPSINETELYPIETTYYYDGMGNKVMTITEGDLLTALDRCDNSDTMFTVYQNCFECVAELGLKTTYYGREAGGKVLAVYNTEGEMNDSEGFFTCNDYYKFIWLDDWYIYGSEADGRIATVDPFEVKSSVGTRIDGSEFPIALSEISALQLDEEIPTAMRDTSVGVASAKYQVQQRRPGYRNYEIKDHLGNVRTVIADYKNPFTTSGPVSNWTYLANVKNISNTYPYGKSYGTNAIYNAVDDYRFGFNGMEKEKNISPSGNTFDFGARVYDSEFPTFLSRDPLEAEFAYQSPFLISGNNPILKIDVNGEWAWVINNWFESYSNLYIDLTNVINTIMKQEKITFKSLITYNIKGIQDELNEYNKKWSNPNNKSYSPKIAEFLKNERINVVIADLSKMKDELGNKKDVLGLANEGQMVMFIDQEQFKQTYGTRKQELENTFLHEIVHLMGGGEFQAFSASLSAGLIDENKISSYFTNESKLLYLLDGSDIKIGDFFTLVDPADALLFDEKAILNRPYKLKSGKEREFFNLMRATGKEYTGSDDE